MYVCKSVSDTFEFPFYQRLWLLYMRSLSFSSFFLVFLQLSQFLLNFLSFSSTFSIFWAQTCSTHNLPSPNFFEPSVPGSLRIFRAFASLFLLLLFLFSYYYFLFSYFLFLFPTFCFLFRFLMCCLFISSPWFLSNHFISKLILGLRQNKFRNKIITNICNLKVYYISNNFIFKKRANSV